MNLTQAEEKLRTFGLTVLHISYEGGEYWVKVGDNGRIWATGLGDTLYRAFMDAIADVEEIAEKGSEAFL